MSFRGNLPVRAGDSPSASAVKKGVDAYDFCIGFRRKREVNPMNKKGKTMKQKRISFGQGKGSLTHNNREFMADNVDPLRRTSPLCVSRSVKHTSSFLLNPLSDIMLGRKGMIV